MSTAAASYSIGDIIRLPDANGVYRVWQIADVGELYRLTAIDRVEAETLTIPRLFLESHGLIDRLEIGRPKPAPTKPAPTKPKQSKPKKYETLREYLLQNPQATLKDARRDYNSDITKNTFHSAASRLRKSGELPSRPTALSILAENPNLTRAEFLKMGYTDGAYYAAIRKLKEQAAPGEAEPAEETFSVGKSATGIIDDLRDSFASDTPTDDKTPLPPAAVSPVPVGSGSGDFSSSLPEKKSEFGSPSLHVSTR